MKTPVYKISIRRDAHTITPVTVAAHEVAVLQTVFGAESVLNEDGRVADVKALLRTQPAGEVNLDPAAEFGRLAAKYGADGEGLLVEQVYGKAASGGLEAAMERAAALRTKADPADPAAPKGGRQRRQTTEQSDPAAPKGDDHDGGETPAQE